MGGKPGRPSAIGAKLMAPVVARAGEIADIAAAAVVGPDGPDRRGIAAMLLKLQAQAADVLTTPVREARGFPPEVGGIHTNLAARLIGVI